MAYVSSVNALSDSFSMLSVDVNQVNSRILLDKKGGESNFTSSLRDPAFASFRESRLTAQQSLKLSNWNFLLNQSRTAIEDHLEKRVSLAFMQAVVCYNTDYIFREGRTIHQGLKAEGLVLADGQKIDFDAAHAATLPSLYAYSTTTNREIVYLYRSGYYDESNATNDLMRVVNQADSAIDFAKGNLRGYLVGLLNRAATSELSPEALIKQFVKLLIDQINFSWPRNRDLRVKDVLELYHDKALALWQYVNVPENIDRWLDLSFDDPHLGKLEEVITQLKEGEDLSRYQLLNLINKKIHNLSPVILQERRQLYNESRAPNAFYDAFLCKVMSRFRNSAALKVVEDALGINFEELDNYLSQFKHLGTTRDILSQNAAKIDALVRDISPFILRCLGDLSDLSQVKIETTQKQISLRPGIYKLRYKIIQEDQNTQSKIKTMLEEVLNSIKSVLKAGHINSFFYYHFLRQFDEYERKMFCKLLNMSFNQLEQEVRELKVNEVVHKTLKAKASIISRFSRSVLQIAAQPQSNDIKILSAKCNALLKNLENTNKHPALRFLFFKRFLDHAETDAEKVSLTRFLCYSEAYINYRINRDTIALNGEQVVLINAKMIQEVKAQAFQLIEILKRETNSFRGKLMAELRLSHGMSQTHFTDLYQGTYPEYPMSKSTLSRVENGEKEIDSDLTKHVSEIFGVSQSLFYPSHFADW